VSKPGKVATLLLVFAIVFLNYFCRILKTVGFVCHHACFMALIILKAGKLYLPQTNFVTWKNCVKYFIQKKITGAGYSSQWQKRPELTGTSTNKLPTIWP
jgi:uncharacterized membrane protein